MQTICKNCKPHVERLEKEIVELRKKYEELEKRVKLYEGPHTPSSKRIIREKKAENKVPKKKGAPEGHKGATRKTPVPEKTVDLKPESCPKCGGGNIVIKDAGKKISEDIEFVKVAKEFIFYECMCANCKKEFTTRSEDMQAGGKFGPNVSALWSMLHYQGTVPFDRLSQISTFMGFPITPKGIEDAIYRTAKIFEPNFERIKNRIKRAKYARSDETSYSFNGKPYWLWNLSTIKDTLVVIRNSRSSKVLTEIFGKIFNGILNTDCFRVYDKFKAKGYQKCLGHIMRDAKDLAKNSEEGEEFYRILGRMFGYIKKVKERGEENTGKVKVWICRAKKRIHGLVGKFESKALDNLVLRMEKHKDSLYTCLKYKFVEPTNNASENDIRKSVTARKVSGLHRSELGLRSREIMMSTILTCRKRGLNPFEFVLNGIRRYNLGIG